MKFQNKRLLAAHNVVDKQISALQLLKLGFGQELLNVANVIERCKGKILVTGIGKSGHIGMKIASTLSSYGLPSFFLHPSEARHGDLGAIKADDLVFLISNSGQSEELVDTIHFCKNNNIFMVGITGDETSFLATNSNITLLLPKVEEACPMGLAPMCSTTTTLVLGDALASLYAISRNLSKEDFGRSHPGGSLGKNYVKIKAVMKTGSFLQLVHTGSPLIDAVHGMSKSRMGCVGVLNEKDELVGVFTDGDLRRCILNTNLEEIVASVMTPFPSILSPESTIFDAKKVLNQKKIPSLFVGENSRNILGIVHIQELI